MEDATKKKHIIIYNVALNFFYVPFKTKCYMLHSKVQEKARFSSGLAKLRYLSYTSLDIPIPHTLIYNK